MWRGRSGRRGRRRGRGRWYDSCDCGCDFCDLSLLSSVLLLFARIARTDRVRAGRADRTATAAIKAYRRVSPRLPTRCRFTPSCSAYGLAAVERYGAGKGLRLTAGRLARCRPGVPYGTPDPVP